MVLALTWSGWSGLLATVGVILACGRGTHGGPPSARSCSDYLAHAAPEVAITEVHVGSLVYQGRDAGAVPRTIALDAFYRQLGAHPGGTAEAEAARLRGLRHRRHHDARPRQPRAGARRDAAGRPASCGRHPDVG